MVGDTGETHGSQKNGIAISEDFQPVCGHHSAVFQIPGTAPGERVVFKFDAPVLFSKGIQDPHTFVDDINADAVAGDKIETKSFQIIYRVCFMVFSAAESAANSKILKVENDITAFCIYDRGVAVILSLLKSEP